MHGFAALDHARCPEIVQKFINSKTQKLISKILRILDMNFKNLRNLSGRKELESCQGLRSNRVAATALTGRSDPTVSGWGAGVKP